MKYRCALLYTFWFSVAAALFLSATGTVWAVDDAGPVCGSGSNAAICFASIDQRGKLDPAQRQTLAGVGVQAIDIISSPDFERELTAFYRTYDWRSRDAEHQGYWRDFNPGEAAARTRESFNGLHIETKGGVRAWFGAKLLGNLAYEGDTRADGTRNIRLNRNRIDRSIPELINTYVHEGGHKAGYRHRASQNDDQKCEPPYIMGQIAQKLADPSGWAAFAKTRNACSYWRE
jgi:hypothetical protein